MYNLIVTAYRNEGRLLQRELGKLGKFRKTKFRDVLVGTVDDLKVFLDVVSEEPPLALARVVPVLEAIEFSKPEALLKVLETKVLEHEFKGSFKMIIERRGWKGEINSMVWAKKLGALVDEHNDNKVDLTDPDVLFVVSIMSDTCAISVLTREMRDEYFFVNSK